MAHAPPRVTVVVINYNGGELVLACLAALRRQTCRDHAVVVVDNASTDGSPQAIAAAFPEVSLLAAGGNLGFAGGVNFALEHAVRSEWLALLNPDAIPEPDWLDALLAESARHPQAAAFGSCMLRNVAAAPDRPILDGTGDAYHVSGMVWRKGYGRPRRPEDGVPGEIFAPCAAAALYRCAAVRAVGGMDAALFCYLEDVDLGFRLRLAGHACRYAPAAVVHHEGSAIAGFHSDFQTYHSHRNIVRVFVKNMPGILFWLFLPAHVAMNLATLLLLALQGRGKAAWRAKRDALKGLAGALRERRIVQASRRIGLGALLRQFVWLPVRR